MTILINDLRLHANHGVMAQERVVGNDFSLSLSLRLGADAIEGARTDSLGLTLSYADVIETVRTVMNTPSALLENVVWRIAEALQRDFPLISGGEITLLKLTPPCSIESAGVGVKISFGN